jgi:hypothetical protein
MYITDICEVLTFSVVPCIQRNVNFNSTFIYRNTYTEKYTSTYVVWFGETIFGWHCFVRPGYANYVVVLP